MTGISFVTAEGEVNTLDVKNGMSVMEAAIRNDIPGIDGECGGACACATCHVYFTQDWFDLVGQPADMEKNMLEFASDVRATSRLSCQIIVKAELEGLVVHTPESQQTTI